MKRCHLASGPPLALHKCINFPCNQVAYKVPPAHVQHLYQTGKPSIYAFSASGAFSRAPPSSPLSDQSAAVMQISSSNWACVCAHLCSAFRGNTCSAGRPKTLALQAMQQATHALIPKPTTRVRLTHNTNTHTRNICRQQKTHVRNNSVNNSNYHWENLVLQEPGMKHQKMTALCS